MGKHGSRGMTTQLKVLESGFSEKLRISDELAECFDSRDDGAMMKVFLVSPFGTAVWHVEVDRDGDGAFLGRRWPEFVEAHGIGVGWFLVLRHEGRGVLTVKAFDANGFVKEFGQTITVPGLQAANIESGRARKPQFIRQLRHDWMEKMPIPDEFLKQRYISDEELNSRVATFVTPFHDIWHIHLEKDVSNVLLAGLWSKFLEFQGIPADEFLLIRYQGNMMFTMEVFGHTGCRRKLEKQGTRFQQAENSEHTNSSQQTEQSEEATSSQKTDQSEDTNLYQETEQSDSSQEISPSEEANSSLKTEQGEEANSSRKAVLPYKEAQSQKKTQIFSRKRKRSEERRVPKNSTNPLDKSARTSCEYEIGLRPWIRKQLNTYTLQRFLALPKRICQNVGLQKSCKITLKSSESNRSWKAGVIANKTGTCHISNGWKIFCLENGLKEGDVCTFNGIRTKMWRVDIERC